MKKIALLALSVYAGLQLSAQSADWKTKSISIFKNGQSFVVKEASVTTKDKSFHLKDAPNALFGTFWFNGLSSRISSVTSKQDSVDSKIKQQVGNIAQLLYANKGQNVTITTTDNKTYSGTIQSFESPDAPLVIIQSGQKWNSINPANIQNIEFSAQPKTVAEIVQKELKPVLDINFDGGGDQKLEMMYLQNGITWVPVYLLELISDTQARIKLQAELSNDAEDIKNTNISLVVGVPNFTFANQLATLLSFSSANNYNSNSYSDYSNAIGSKSYMLRGQMASKEMVMDNIALPENNIDAESTGDLYFYPIKNVSLVKNGRGSYPIFESTIPVKHIYECNLSTNNIMPRYDDSNNDDNDAPNTTTNDVTHKVEIKNDTKNPFTTGSVMVVDEKTQRSLAQNILTYTAINQKSNITLTTAPDVKVKESQKIVDTQDEVRKKGSYTYNYKRYTIQAEVTIVNSKSENINMVINKTIEGKSQKSSIDYTSQQVPNTNSNNLNPTDYLRFNLVAKSAQKTTFTYTYIKYVQV